MADPQKRKVVGASADSEGDISHVKLSGNSNFTSVEKAIQMADRGELVNAHAVHKKDGTSYLRSNPDGVKKNNLDDMAGDN